jgi:hypothetical protein
VTFDLGATPTVAKRLQKGLPQTVDTAWTNLKHQLGTAPRFVGPDKRDVWKQAFPDIPNHRHSDLPDAWRACWTIRNINDGEGERVTVVFLGTHKEYDRLYGFRTN